MKTTFLFAALIFTMGSIRAQGTLQFNAVKTVSDQLETVPAGKVWKVTATYGTTLFCDEAIKSNCIWGSEYTKHVFLTSSFLVNGTRIFSFNDFAGGKYQTCSYSGLSVPTGTALNDCLASSKMQGFPQITANPNILPIWLEAGTTLQTSASTIFLSVMEFNIIP